MASIVPDTVTMKAWLVGQVPFANRVEQVLALARSLGLPEPTQFTTPVGGKTNPIAYFDAQKISSAQLCLNANEGYYTLALALQEGDRVLISATLITEEMSETECGEVLRALTSFLRALFDTNEVDTGFVQRLESGLGALPFTPLSLHNVALVVRDAEVKLEYREPHVFFAAWDTQQTRGDQHFLSRAEGAVTASALFDALFFKQWAMARAARVGSVRYGRRKTPPGCEHLLHADEPRLRQVGYRNGHVELAAVVFPPSEIEPWEVLYWNEVISKRALPDGSPVSEVRAVFRDEATARRHARVLLGVHMNVVYLGADGAFHPVPSDV
jgi:hypothetical protein